MLDFALRALAEQMAKVSTKVMSIMKETYSDFSYHPLPMTFFVLCVKGTSDPFCGEFTLFIYNIPFIYLICLCLWDTVLSSPELTHP